MKRSLYAFLIAIFFASFGLAQTTVTSTISVSGTIQTGFVVITPIAGTGQGLSVSETFGEQVGGALFQSSVLSSPLITLTDIVVNVDPILGLNTGVAFVNPNNATATVTLTLGNQQGAAVAARTLTVDPHQQVSKFVTELFAGEPATTVPMTGLLFINSTSPVGVLGLSFNGLSFTSLPVASQLSANASVGSGTVGTFTAIPATSITGPVVSTVTGVAGTQIAPAVPTTITQIPSTFPGLVTQSSISGVTTPPTAIPVTGTVPITSPVIPLTGTAQFTTTPAPTGTTVVSPAVFIMPEIAAGIGGTGSLLLPQVAAGGGWVSQITIANTSGTPQTVRVDFFDSMGAPLLLPFGSSVPSVVINPGGVATFSTGS
jgi:hypothetical protein